MKISRVVFSAALLIILGMMNVPAVAVADMTDGNQVIVKEAVRVNELGDIHLEMTYTYPANFYTTSIAPSKVNPFLISEIRYLRSGQSTKEIPKDSITVEFSDVNSAVTVTCDAMGYTRNMRDYWELETSAGSVLTSQSERQIILTSTEQDAYNIYLYTSTINFPEGTKDIRFNQDTGKVKYTLPYKNSGGFPVIWWIIIAVVACAVIVGVFVFMRKRA